MTSSTIRTLRERLCDALLGRQGVVTVHLFGSALQSESPNDIDLAVVYDTPLTPLTAPEVGPAVQEAVRSACGLPAHLTFFTASEAEASPLLSESELIYERPA
jgi:predicted nucleotidyltransferase